MIDKSIRLLLFNILKLNISEDVSEKIIQFIKFGLVGVLNNLISYGLYILLIQFEIYYTFANIIGFSVSVLNSYFWNNRYVFTTHQYNRIWWKTFLKTYISYAGTGIILGNGLLILWVEVFSVSKVVAPILNLIITIPINFFINKYWAYKK